MASDPIQPILFPQKAFNQLQMEVLQPYNENHFAMDHIQNNPLYASSNIHLSLVTPCVSYPCQNVGNALPRITLSQNSFAWPLSSNNNTSSQNVSRQSNVCVKNSNRNEPLFSDILHQLLPKNGSFSNNDLNNKIISKLTKIDSLVKGKHSKRKTKRTVNLQKNELMKETKTNKTVKSVSNESEHDSFEMKSLKTLSLTEKTTDSTISEPLNEVILTKSDENICIRAIVEKDSSDLSNGEENYCLVCDITFWTEELLNTHLNGNEFSCRVCTATFINHSELRTHFLSHRSQRCLVCMKVFICKADLYNHKNMSPACSSKSECDICKKVLSNKESVQKHKKSIHHNEKSYCCVVCDKKFTLPCMLTAHQNSCHVAYETMECKFCSLSYLGPEKLKYHTKTSHLLKKEMCPFTCSICGKTLYFKSALEKHEKSHIEAKKIVQCEFCGKSCSGKRGLFDHILYFHKDVNNVKCSTCNQEFKHKKHLWNHIRNVHKQKVQAPVVCEICGKTLKNKTQLKTHLEIHSSERQYKCDICNATFKQRVALRTHSRIHTGICKYNCNNCGETFKWKQTFDKHITKCKITLST